MTSIEVDYKHAEGWHVFTSKALPGLYVASKDPEVAYRDVTVSVEKLLKLNAHITCKVTPELSFGEFMRSLRGDVQAPIHALKNQRYALQACA